MAGIREWLEQHGLGDHAGAFEVEQIELSDLPDLTDDDRSRERGPKWARPLLGCNRQVGLESGAKAARGRLRAAGEIGASRTDALR